MNRGVGGLRYVLMMLMLWVGECIAVRISTTSALFLLSVLRNNMTGWAAHYTHREVLNQHYPYRGVVQWNFLAKVIVNPISFLKLLRRLPLSHANVQRVKSLHTVAPCFLTLKSRSSNSCIMHNIPSLNVMLKYFLLSKLNMQRLTK